MEFYSAARKKPISTRKLNRKQQRYYDIPELPCASVSKQVFVENLSYENEFDLHENESVGRTHYYMKGPA